jgi:hypothetical protein
MSIAFVVCLIIGVVAATAYVWIYVVPGWSLRRAFVCVGCAALVAPVCLFVACVVVLAVLVAPFCLLFGWVLGI